MTRHDQLVESIEAMDEAMERTSIRRDIWQNEIIYHICKAVRLLLLEALKERNTK